MLSHPEFVNECTAQGVILDRNLSEVAKDMYAASYSFGYLLEEGARLSNCRIKDTSFCTDAISRAHASIITSSHHLTQQHC